MSSILEALKKLEAEKAANKTRQRSATPSSSGYTESEILAPAGEVAPGPPRFSQGAMMIVVASVLAVAVVGTSVITVSLMTSADEPDNGTAPVRVAVQAPPVQAGQLVGTPVTASAGPHAAVEAATTASMGSAQGSESTKGTAPAPEIPQVPPAPKASPSVPVASAAAKVREETEKPKPVKTPEKVAPPAAPEPESEAPEPTRLTAVAQEKESPAPELPKAEPAPPAANREPAAPREPFKPEIIAVGKLLPMRTADREKYGLEDIKVNMLRGISETRPYGQAIINLDKVMVGEVIPETKVLLISIDEHLGKIGVEVLETGERFSFP